MTWSEIWDKIVAFLSTGGITILKVIGVFVLGYVAIRVIKYVVRKLLKKTPLSSLIQKYVMNTITFALYFVLLIIILQAMGLEISALLAALSAAGLALALALQDTLKSLTNGIVLLVTKPFKENDFIKMENVVGHVRSIGFFTTTVETLDNVRLIIPNKNMVNYTIENNTFYDKRRFSYKFKVSHSTDISQLETIVKNAILSNPNVFTKPEPVLLCKEIDEDGVLFEARGFCPSVMPLFERTEADVLQTIYNELKKNNIEIANKKIIVYNEQRPEFYVDQTPLPQRDMSKEPQTNHQQDIGFYEYVDKMEENSTFSRAIKKGKIRRQRAINKQKRKKAKKQKSKAKTENE